MLQRSSSVVRRAVAREEARLRETQLVMTEVTRRCDVALRRGAS